jgi:hypothetical protein
MNFKQNIIITCIIGFVLGFLIVFFIANNKLKPKESINDTVNKAIIVAKEIKAKEIPWEREYLTSIDKFNYDENTKILSYTHATTRRKFVFYDIVEIELQNKDKTYAKLNWKYLGKKEVYE